MEYDACATAGENPKKQAGDNACSGEGWDEDLERDGRTAPGRDQVCACGGRLLAGVALEGRNLFCVDSHR